MYNVVICILHIQCSYIHKKNPKKPLFYECFIMFHHLQEGEHIVLDADPFAVSIGVDVGVIQR